MRQISTPEKKSNLLLGYVAALVAVLIWAGWITITRFAMTEKVEPVVLAVFRYGIPALALAPFWIRRGIVPRGGSLKALILMTLGWGFPFVLWTGEGLKTVPAGLMGPLVPGFAPLLVGLLGWLIFRDAVGRSALLGYVLISAGVGTVLGQWAASGDLSALSGAPFLICGALGWALYTVWFRRSGLNPIEATTYVGLYSLPALAVLAAWKHDAFASVELGDMAFHALTQGVATGIGSVIAYGIAIQQLGTVRASATIALVPVCTGILGAIFLGERLTMVDWLAIMLASLGVAMANGVFDRLIRRQR